MAAVEGIPEAASDRVEALAERGSFNDDIIPDLDEKPGGGGVISSKSTASAGAGGDDRRFEWQLFWVVTAGLSRLAAAE